ncbi:MAG: hypothetical protein AMXMBFR67_08370 [Nitrospira sp.]
MAKANNMAMMIASAYSRTTDLWEEWAMEAALPIGASGAVRSAGAGGATGPLVAGASSGRG